MRKILLLSLLLAGCAPTEHVTYSNGVDVQPDYQKAYQDYVALGARYLGMGRPDLAEPKLKRAIEINPGPPEAWNALAVLYEGQRNIQAGYQTYLKLTSSHPNYALGFVNFATFLCKFNRTPERMTLYQQMRAKGPVFATLSYISEGNCDADHGHSNEAIVAYRQALRYDPHAAGALLPLAKLLLARGDAQEALKDIGIIHTYIGYSAESVALGIAAARATGNTPLVEQLTQVMRSSYAQSPQAQQLGL